MAKKKQTYTHNKPILIVTTILLLSIIFPIILSYSNFYPPFFDKKIIYFLDSVVVDIPFLPKTPKQVFTKSLIRNQNLQNYHLTSKLDLDSGKGTLLEFTATQAVEKAGSFETKTRAKIVGNINFIPGSQTEFETIKSQNELYFKITSLSRAIGINTDNLQKEWYKIDLDAFQKTLGVKARNDQQIIDDIRVEFQKVQAGLIDKSIFNKVKSFKKTKIAKHSFYEIKLVLDQNSFKKFPLLSELKIDKPILILWVNSESYYLTKLDLVGDVLSKNSKVETNSNLKLHFSSVLSNIGSKQNFEMPKNPTVIKDPLDLAMKSTQTIGDVDKLFAATALQKDLGENFLTVERLISVLLLIPKAI